MNQQPYLKKTIKIVEYCYNPNYGDDRICKCGHPYYRHFDTYEHMDNVGCKYCDCMKFEETTVVPHTCPYREDLYGDNRTLCVCDEERTNACWSDI